MKNKKVALRAILALVFIILTFAVSWYFIIGAVILMALNQKDLMRKQ